MPRPTISWIVQSFTILSLLGFAIAAPQSPSISPPAVVASVGRPVDESSQNGNHNNEESTQILNNLPNWRRQLPFDLQNKTKTLQRIVVPGPNGCRVEVYLLGTAHVSTDSSRDVLMLLEAVEPGVLFLELCDQRIPMMLEQSPAPQVVEQITTKSGFWSGLQKKKNPTPPKGSRSLYGVAAGLLTNMQEDYASSLGVELGGEFRVACKFWKQQRQTRPMHLILGDRPLDITLTRAWESLHLWGKTKLIASLIFNAFQKPNPDELREWMQKILADETGDILTESIAELGRHFPSLERIIIQERDAYMASKLYQTCRQLLQTSKHPNKVQKIVAIVGAGHVKGMCELLTQGNGKRPEEILAPLLETKKGILEEDRDILIFDVLEVNHEQLAAIATAMQEQHNKSEVS